MVLHICVPVKGMFFLLLVLGFGVLPDNFVWGGYATMEFPIKDMSTPHDSNMA